MDRRLGRFVVARKLIESEPAKVAKALSGLIVVRAERRYDYDGIEYVAIGQDFAEVPKGGLTPWYTLHVGHDGTPTFAPMD